MLILEEGQPKIDFTLLTVGIFLFFFFFNLRPQNKQRKHVPKTKTNREVSKKWAVSFLKWRRSVMSIFWRPCRLYPTRLLQPWDSPGKNAKVGCHFFSRGSSQPRDRTQVSCIGGRCFNLWATSEALKFLKRLVNVPYLIST